MSLRVGGIDQEDKPADASVHEIVAKIKSDVETAIGRPVPQMVAESYRTQLVNGVNYFIKLHIGDENTRLHVRAYKPFTGEPTYVAHKTDKPIHEPILYF